MFYERKIKYLDYYEGGEKIRGGGFVKLELREEKLRMELTVKGLYPTDSFVRDVMLRSGGLEAALGQIMIQNGTGVFRYAGDLDNEMGHTGIVYRALREIRIPIGGSRELICPLAETTRSYVEQGIREEAQRAIPQETVKTVEEGERMEAPENSERFVQSTEPVQQSAEEDKSDAGLPQSEEHDRSWVALQQPGIQDETHAGPQQPGIQDETHAGPQQPGIQDETRAKLQHSEAQNEIWTELHQAEEGNRAWVARQQPETQDEAKPRLQPVDRKPNIEELEASKSIETLRSGVHLADPEKKAQNSVKESHSAGRGKSMEKLLEDKWQQLSAIYPHIQPFQDERDYLSISPSDFVLFPSRCYKAVNNSFLLHGYYNYDHLILARMERRGEILYYIGVPGNYFDREKQVAIMFGFESFECAAEPAKTGDFGYYMMRTEL